MSKSEVLEFMKLLSALESWSFANKTMLPDYLHESLQRCMDITERELLNEGVV